MKVLLDDGFQIKKGTGIGKYSLYLYRHLKNNNVDIDLYEMNSQNGKLNNRIQYIKHINSKAYRKYTEKYDVIIYTNYCMPKKKNKHSKYVVCIPDMVSFLYPKTLPYLYRIYNKMVIKNSMKKADLVVTISNSVKNEIISFFTKYKNKIEYTWLGIYDEMKKRIIPKVYKNENLSIITPNDNFFLFVSTVEKRKNVNFVIDAFEQFSKKYSNYKLIIVGRPGYGYNEILDNANSKECKKNIIFTGFTSDEDVIKLYNDAKAFIFPSTYEGFGFAQIECMISHLPIIESNIPTNLEISREYGLYFDLNDLNSLVDKMCIIANEDIDMHRLIELSDDYVKDFDWDKIAKQYIKFLNSIIELD